MLLLEKVFKVLNDCGLDYCVQNKYEMMPEEIPSDIDMMYRGANEKKLDEIVSCVSQETGLLITQKIVQDYFEYTYILSPKAPKDKFQLQLDFYKVISHGKDRNILLGEDLLERKRFYKIFYVPSYEDEIIYIIVRRTLKKDFSQDHLNQLISLCNMVGMEQAMSYIANKLGGDVAESISQIIQKNNAQLFFVHYDVFRASVALQKKKNYRILDAAKYYGFKLWNYPRNRIWHKCGLSVAFLAPDGAGKSTVIQEISKTCSGSFYGVENLYFRPRVLKNAGHYNLVNPTEEAATNFAPHEVKLDSKFKSFVRFMFYNVDFIVGNFTKVNYLKMKKKLIIFDRYYYDYYADMRRYKYSLNSNIAKRFSCMIPKPDMVFVLDAPSEVIYARKKELTIPEIERQRECYKTIRGNVHIIDVNRSIDEIVNDVTSLILEYQSERTKRIMRNE